MIRDNVFPAARWRIPPECDELASQRVSELCGTSLAGLTFTVYSSIQQLCRALEEGATFRVYEKKCVANGGSWSQVWKIKVVNSEQTAYSLWLWQTPREVTVLTVAFESLGNVKPSAKKEFDELVGE